MIHLKNTSIDTKTNKKYKKHFLHFFVINDLCILKSSIANNSLFLLYFYN